MNTLIKYLITLALFCAMAKSNEAQTRQIQTIVNMWDREFVTEIFSDTITSDIQYSDTVDISRNTGSPKRFSVFLKLDSLEGLTDQINLTASFEPALTDTGPFYVVGDGSADFIPDFPPFNSTGQFIFPLTPAGGNHIRFAFSCTDTLFLQAILWMKH